MIAATGLRWILTLLFAVPAAHALWCALRPGARAAARVDHAVHAAMGVLMAAMAWPRGMDLPAAPQIALFSVGALWFVVAAPFRTRGRTPLRTVLAAWPDVLTTAAMVWMLAAMASGTAHGHGGGGGAHGAHHTGGGSGAATMSLPGAGQSLTAGLLAAVLLALGVVRLAAALDRARAGRPAPRAPAPVAAGDVAVGDGGGPALDDACHAAMALGMAVMFALMV
ncbi:DUF5134 domain-containing protein [Streptomyces phytohabitans]|uniref:DUF5134 domain-containing protein n=1 Tax=Streptomyces phytohabitans TaxID=1150371 RepID=UPI00345C44BA